jgi:2-aminobenzoate-CoA ligase
VLKARADDRFIGSPPLAFTFGLGGHLLFPLRVGASTILLENAPARTTSSTPCPYTAPPSCFTAPTAYRAILRQGRQPPPSPVRACVSAGEHAAEGHASRPGRDATGISDDGRHRRHRDAAHLHLAPPPSARRPGSTGEAVPRLRGPHHRRRRATPSRRHPVGAWPSRGPTGCRYMDDARQAA